MCLLFAFRDPSHERAVAEELRRRRPDAHVVASHEVAPEFREYERASTTAADAYLGPVVARLPPRAPRRVSSRVASGAARHALLGRRRHDRRGGRAPGADPRLRPCGRRDGAERIAALAGCRERDRLRHGRHLDGRLPDRGRPGRARGGAGGGRLPGAAPDGRHPHGRRGRRLDRLARCGRSAAGRAAQRRRGARSGVLRARRVGAHGDGREPAPRPAPARAAGRARCSTATPPRRRSGRSIPRTRSRSSNAEMLRALRVVSVERGHDPRDFALVAFGGAGPLHACALADELGCRRRARPGGRRVLSALGLVVGDERRDHVALARPPARRRRRAAAGRRGEPPLPRPVVRALRPSRARSSRSASTARTRSGTGMPTAAVPSSSSRVRCGRRRARALRSTSRTGRGASSRGRSSWCSTVRPAGSRTAGRGDRTPTGRSCWSGDDRRRAAGDRERPARGRGGDGRGADPRRVLVEHQGAPRLLHGALRPGRSHGRAGRAHPRPSRGDAGGGRGGHGPRPRSRRGLGAERPLRGRDAPAGHHARLADRPRLRGQPGAPRRRRRHRAREPARVLDRSLRGRACHPADPPRRRARSSRSPPALAIRTSAAATFAHSSPRTASPNGASAELVSRRGRRRVEQAMDELYAYSARRVRAGLAGLPDGRYEAEDVIEAGRRRPRRSERP